MQIIRQILLLLCAFVFAFIIGVHLGLNISSGRYAEEPPISTRSRRSPYFTVDSAEWMDNWSKVSSNVYLFSAFFDPRMGDNATVVRVLGLMRLRPTLNVTCSCLIDEAPAQSVVAKVQFLQDHHHAKYDGVFITCPYLPSNSSGPPRIVRVIVNGTETGTSKGILVHSRTPPPGDGLDSLALCVRPFYSGVPKLHDLQHFIAYYSQHGVQRFTFYSYSSRQDVEEYLWTLRHRLKVDFLPWSLAAAKNSWALAQNAFTQDCLYRHANASRRVLIVDLDEFVFPFPTRGGRLRTVAELVAQLPATKPCLVVRNVFWVRAASSQHQPFIFASLNRSRRTWPTGLRSKYVADPLRVLEGGIHFCRRFLPDGVRDRDKQLTVSQALLFHYRGVRGEKYATDTRMLAWKERVMSSPLMPKRDLWRRAAFGVRDSLRNSFDLLVRLLL
ncbi:hypothetical protein V5799_014897 [Amblyomma americanum]|uniref:Glycosyltransferase family 92 protein n=1 Tax=Amblyomma americanum TaxID=6943 RepID=A0AAQ4E1P6_AMBAM